MATDTYAPETKKSGMPGCLKGCLIALVIFLILGAIGVWWVAKNAKSWAGAGTAAIINQVIDESDLPAAEKEELKAESKRVTDGLADGSVSFDQLGQVITGFVESPLVPMFIVKGIEAKYLNQSGLSDEEKAEGKVTLERYISGLMSKQIPQNSIDQVMVHVADKDEQGEWQLREQLSDDELRSFLAAAKQAADDASVAEDPEPVDPSDELKKVIDGVLGPAVSEPETP